MKTTDYCPDRGISKGNFLMLMFFSCTIFFFSSAYTVSAQDKIITKDAQTINGTVVEVNPYDIKYKRTDNPEGPTFVLKKSEIATIIYGNGSIEVFNEDEPEQPEEQDFSSRRRYSNEPGKGIKIGDPYDGGCWFDPENPQPFNVIGDEWAYGDRNVDYSTIYQILRLEAPDLSSQLMSNIRLGRAGVALFSAGTGIACMGLLFMIADSEYLEELFWAGYGMLMSGTILAVPVGVTMWSVGYKRRDRAVKDYNTRVDRMHGYSSVPEHEFKLIQSRYGVGIAFTF